MRKTILAAGIVASALVAAAPASANVAFIFTPGPANSPSSGFAIVDDFNNTSTALDGWTPTSNISLQTGSDSNGAQPANSNPGGTQYLSVLGGGSATYTFASPVSAFEFDWGSADSYNFLTIYTDLNTTGYTMSGGFIPPANGDQAANSTNGLFSAYADPGEKITGFKLASDTNSFEIDNLASAVPEPGSWALMLLGFGGLGALARRRRQQGSMQVA